MPYILFARWFGMISLLLSLGILFNLDDAQRMAKNMVESDSGYIMGGVLPIVFGSLAFVEHHAFQVGWHLVVTLIALLMLGIGIFRVIFIKQWKKVIDNNSDKIPALFSLFGLIFGLLLIYVGFLAPIVRHHGF